MLPISTTEADQLNKDRDGADMLFAAAFGVGGSLWSVQRTRSSDRTAPTTVTVYNAIVLYVVNTHDFVLRLSPTETEVPDGQWRFITLAVNVLRPGDVVVSSAHPTLRFTVVSASSNGRTRSGIVEQLGITTT